MTYAPNGTQFVCWTRPVAIVTSRHRPFPTTKPGQKHLLANPVESESQGVLRLLSPELTGRIETAVADHRARPKQHLEEPR